MHLRKLHVGFACLSPSNLPEMQAAIALVCTQRAAAAAANAATALAYHPRVYGAERDRWHTVNTRPAK